MTTFDNNSSLNLIYRLSHILHRFDTEWRGGRYKPILSYALLAYASSYFIFLPLVFLFILTSCVSKSKYITDSSDYTSFGIDYHDIENMVSERRIFFGL